MQCLPPPRSSKNTQGECVTLTGWTDGWLWMLYSNPEGLWRAKLHAVAGAHPVAGCAVQVCISGLERPFDCIPDLVLFVGLPSTKTNHWDRVPGAQLARRDSTESRSIGQTALHPGHPVGSKVFLHRTGDR